MLPSRLNAVLTVAALNLSARWRRLLDSGDRGSETTEKVMWIALLIALVLAVYAIFNSKIIGKISGIEL